MSEQDQQVRENRSSSDNSGKSKEKSAMNPPKARSCKNLQKEEIISARGKKRSGSDGKEGGESEDHEAHIWTERERRKKMRDMFSSLHAMLPSLPSKAEKSTIVDEAVNYIKTLEQTLQDLQKQELERLQSVSNYQYAFDNSREAFITDQGCSTKATTSNPSIVQHPVGFQTWVSPNVVLNICGEEAQFSVCSRKKQCLFSTICYVLEKHKIEVLSAHISSDNHRCLYMIQAHAKRDSDKFLGAFSVEETFKRAAGEILQWLS